MEFTFVEPGTVVSAEVHLRRLQQEHNARHCVRQDCARLLGLQRADSEEGVERVSQEGRQPIPVERDEMTGLSSRLISTKRIRRNEQCCRRVIPSHSLHGKRR